MSEGATTPDIVLQSRTFGSLAPSRVNLVGFLRNSTTWEGRRGGSRVQKLGLSPLFTRALGTSAACPWSLVKTLNPGPTSRSSSLASSHPRTSENIFTDFSGSSSFLYSLGSVDGPESVGMIGMKCVVDG